MTSEIEEAVARDLQMMATTCSVDMELWDRFSNGVLSVLSALAASQAEVERLTRERDEAKSRGDNHWQTLRSIREMAREGDTDRIILWVNDAGSGHTEGAEQTLKTVSDQRNAVEARATRAEGLLEEVYRALDDHNSLLRSAFQAAQRDATHDVRGTTNYRLLADRAHEVLTGHHATTNAARAFLDKLKEQG